ncbi:MAG: hypothetical protein JAY67_19470 [Candidatus Thiodiazotropha taylori]|nr:hypothetical protein [Candidatus Thiodiazotropha taylori]
MADKKTWLKTLLIFLAVAAVATLALGWITVTLGDPVSFKENLWDTIASRLELLLVVAVLIERSVEVYLYATDNNGPNRFARGGEEPYRTPATKRAAIAAIALGVVLAVVGVRVLDAAVSTAITGIQAWLWTGADVIISAGLLAGGSVLVHELMELLRGGLDLGTRAIRGEKRTPVAPIAPAIASEYQVKVRRTSNDMGKLTFNENGVNVDSDCWWDPNVRITAGTYTGCSATRMASKEDSVTGEKRPGIFLPTAVAPDTRANTIFIHEGKDATWSDGCIVLPRDDMMRMWNSIEKNARNVTVQVIDA